MSIIEAAAQFAKARYPAEGIPHIREMLHYCDLFAAETGADREILTVATYLHDIAAHLYDWEEHDVKSAEVARKFLDDAGYPPGKTARVIAAIMAHRLPRSGAEAKKMAIEDKVLYDADKLARAMGLGVVAHLLELPGKVPGGKPSFAQIAEAIQAAQKQMEETYKSLYTEAARNFASQAHQSARAFCDSLRSLDRLRPECASW
jgi:HD superfamily phosphodiesterase